VHDLTTQHARTRAASVFFLYTRFLSCVYKDLGRISVASAWRDTLYHVFFFGSRLAFVALARQTLAASVLQMRYSGVQHLQPSLPLTRSERDMPNHPQLCARRGLKGSGRLLRSRTLPNVADQARHLRRSSSSRKRGPGSQPSGSSLGVLTLSWLASPDPFDARCLLKVTSVILKIQVRAGRPEIQNHREATESKSAGQEYRYRQGMSH